jgi:diamine N-acetyltransferase
LESNTKARKFYLKSGFEETGKHVFEIGKERFDFIAMAKNLD